MSFQLSNRQRGISLSPEAKEALVISAEAVIQAYGPAYGGAQLTLVSPKRIQELNRETRGLDSVTDVLSFPQVDWDSYPLGQWPQGDAFLDMDTGEYMMGDVIICLQRAAEQAKAYGHSLERELAFLCVHGLLHLCGYDHQNQEEEAEMRRMSETVLAKSGLSR